MRKRDELTDPKSCMNHAQPDEWTFVLLGRDKAAPVAVRSWIKERIRLGKNAREDPQITEAESWIAAVLAERQEGTDTSGRSPEIDQENHVEDSPDITTFSSMPDFACVDVSFVAALLACSERHVWRMAEEGVIPSPLKLGRLRRWQAGVIREWIRDARKKATEPSGGD